MGRPSLQRGIVTTTTTTTETIMVSRKGRAKKKSVAKAPVPRPLAIRDSVLSTFCAAVANPFDGPLVRGIDGAGGHTATAIVRRRNICTVSLSGGSLSGYDVFIPNGVSTDPFVFVATNAAADWSGARTVTEYNRDPTVTIPVGASARVVASGIRITCLDSVTNTGGIVYHFWTPSTSGLGGVTYPAVDRTVGATKAGATEAITLKPITPSGRSMTFINPTGGSFDTVRDASLSTAASIASGGGWPDCAAVRFFIDGPASMTKLLFEISTVVEYYHDTHKNLSAPTMMHPSGSTAVANVNSALMQRGSNASDLDKHGGSSSLTTKLQRLTGAIEAGGKAVMTGMGTAYNLVQGSRALRALMAGAESAAIVAL